MRTVNSILLLFILLFSYGQKIPLLDNRVLMLDNYINIINPLEEAAAEEPESTDYTTLYTWDYESETLGEWTQAEVDAYIYKSQFNTAWNRAEIVNDTVNSTPIKAVKVIMDDGVDMMQRGLQARSYFNAARTKHDSICRTQRIKFDKNFEGLNGNGKFGGLQIAYASEDQTPPADCGTGTEVDKVSASFLYKPYNKIQDYQYSFENQQGSCPWAAATVDGFQWDSCYFIPGVWYDVTECVRINTFNGSTPNADGIFEAYVYDDLIFQRNDIKFVGHDTSSWNTFRLSTFSSDDMDDGHSRETYIYLGGDVLWQPGVSDTSFHGSGVHQTSYKMTDRPNKVTDKTVVYDTLVDVSSVSNEIYTTSYPSSTGSGFTHAWLIDAGEGNTVTASVIDGDLGSSDLLAVYDGNESDDPMIGAVFGSDANFHTDCFGGDGVVTSTQRYMFIHTLGSNVGGMNFRIQVQK